MNISIRQLEAFLHIARLKNFTRAAERIHVSQAGLSGMIQELEQQLDCRLFNRTTRTVSLTEAGITLVPAAERALEELGLAASAISQVTSTSRRTLSLSTTPLLAASVLPKVCSLFQTLRPDVSVRIHDVDRGQVQELVDNGKCDVGFGVFTKPVSGLEREWIFDFTLVHVAPIDRRAKQTGGKLSTRRGSIAWKDLKDVPLIGFPPDNPTQKVIDSHLAQIGRANEDRASFNSLQALLSMVEAGFGTTIVQSFAMAGTSHMQVTCSELTGPAVQLPFYKLTKKDRAHSDSLSDFVDCFVKVVDTFLISKKSYRKPIKKG